MCSAFRFKSEYMEGMKKKIIVDGINKHKRTCYVFMTNEARALKKLREAKGLSMKKAGELLGYSDSYVSQIENGRENVPTEDKLLKFLEAYDVDARIFKKTVRELEANLTDLEVIQGILPRLRPEKLKLLKSLAEQLIKSNE